MKGVSFLEVILVIALIAILATATAPFAANSLRQQQFISTVGILKSYLLKAQSYAMSNKGSGPWGVCQTSSTIRLYSSSCSSPAFSEDFSIPQSVNVTGLSDVSFNSPRGEPSQTLSLTVSGDNRSINLTLSPVGTLEDN
ncbi:MAG TPA: prepilin-type N-terminal cleavage/methylation domain-containing protein [Candidatus Saccharimonadales bacterium]|nr:prepilin-type N-terminal cleavage/methylation domain-containing protein [Candidatus Saccharimonadales bacterium]